MKTRFSCLAIAWFTGLAVSSICSGTANAQCITPEVKWQYMSTNILRCGIMELWRTNYYVLYAHSRLETLDQWTTSEGSAVDYSLYEDQYSTNILFDVTAFQKTTTSSNYQENANLDRESGSGCNNPPADSGTSPDGTEEWLEAQGTTGAPNCAGSYYYLSELVLSQPVTAQELASEALARLRKADEDQWIGHPSSSLFTQVSGSVSGQPYNGFDYIGGGAQLVRYSLNFKTKLNTTNKLEWTLRVSYYDNIVNGVVTNVSLMAFVIEGIVGTGEEFTTIWHEIPEPPLNTKIGAEIVDSLVTVTGGDCSSEQCSSDSGSTGDGPSYLNSAGFLISLGAGSVDASAGSIRFDEAIPSSAIATLSALPFNVNTNVVTVVTNGDGTIHLAAPTMLARLEQTNAYAYWIHCSALSGGAYLTNSPFISHLIVNPNGSTNFNTLLRIKYLSGLVITNQFVCEAADAVTNTWKLTTGNGMRGERLSQVTFTNSTRLDTHTVFTPTNSQELFRRERLYWTTPQGEFLLREVIDPAGLALTTTNSYDSSGRLTLSVHPDGSWERREYDPNGWLTRIVRPFTNQPPTASTNACRVTEYSYSSVSGSGDDSAIQVSKPRVVWELVKGEVLSKTMHSYSNLYVTYTQVAGSASAGWNDASNERTRQEVDSQSRNIRSDQPDGTHSATTFTDDGSGRLTVVRLYDSGGTEFRRTETQVNLQGRMVSTKTYEGSVLMDQALYSNPDVFGRPTTTTFLDASTESNVKQDCCNLAYTIDRFGVTNTYTYDALKRLVSTTRLGITVSNMLDAAGQIRAQIRIGSTGSSITQRAIAYDAAGRVIRETNALGGVTSYSYSVDGNSQSVTIVTNADLSTRVETRFRDGELASMSGTAAFPVRYVYGVTNESGTQRAYTMEIKLDASGNDTPEWTQAFADAAGRNYKTIFAGSGTPYRQSFYNPKGQLWKERDPDGVITLYTNNARGELAYSCIDSNRNNVIDFSGQDRVTQVTNDLVSAHGTNVIRSRTYVWETDGSSTPTLLSTVERSVEGLKTWQTSAGVLTSSERSLPSSGTYTMVQYAPDASSSVSLYSWGRLLSVTRYDSNSVQIGKTSFGYDAHGRQATVTDARTGPTTYGFNDADQVVTVTTPSPGTPGGTAQTTTTSYDAMGRATSIVQPDGASVVNAYSLRGELIRTSGSRTYPVGYAYDAQGRMKHMTNWSGFGAGSGARLTTWHYDASRGWLTNKVYDDGKGTKYSYTAAGRLSSRLWARGTNTTYTYNNFGDLSEVSYNDGATPSVTYSYDRRGRQRTVARGSDSWKLFYNTAGQLVSEAGTAGTLNGLRTTNGFDWLLRRTNVLAANGATALTTNAYMYDAAGRLDTVREGVFWAQYSYLANSPLVSQIVLKSNSTVRLTTTKDYDFLNRLTTISSQPAGTAQQPLNYTYSYNDANQRTRVNLADGSFWIYQYDSLGQVVSGKRYWSDWTPVAGQQFEYDFDDIGNRTSTKAGGDQNGAGLRSASYTANNLNQITQREVPGYLNILGAATATATNVNVNNQMAYRRGEYYWKELSVNNASVPLWQSVTNRAVQNGTTNSVTGNVFLPKTPEVLTYDADGNLTNDGRWAYVWDGENRLTRMFAPTTGPTGSVKSLQFGYDWQGRRISKTVSNWSGSAWTKVLDEKFLYDGWNLLSSLNASNNAVGRSFLWGNDLSGSLQGAGGVGGLLAVSARGSSASFTAYDGNGNVIGLINAADGTNVVKYEYGPFGEVIRCSGTAAKANPFRFSTKYQDEETDLLYYGYRYLRHGCWLNRDPLSEVWHSLKVLYPFCGNDSLNEFDVDGRINWAKFVEDWAKKIAPEIAKRLMQDPLTIEEIHYVTCPADCDEFLRREEKTVTQREATASFRLNLNAVMSKKLIDILIYRHSVKEYGCCRKPQCGYQRFTKWKLLEDESSAEVSGFGFHDQKTFGDDVIFLDVVATDVTKRSSRTRNCIAPCTPLSKQIWVRVCRGGKCEPE